MKLTAFENKVISLDEMSNNSFPKEQFLAVVAQLQDKQMPFVVEEKMLPAMNDLLPFLLKPYVFGVDSLHSLAQYQKQHGDCTLTTRMQNLFAQTYARHLNEHVDCLYHNIGIVFTHNASSFDTDTNADSFLERVEQRSLEKDDVAWFNTAVRDFIACVKPKDYQQRIKLAKHEVARTYSVDIVSARRGYTVLEDVKN